MEQNWGDQHHEHPAPEAGGWGLAVRWHVGSCPSQDISPFGQEAGWGRVSFPGAEPQKESLCLTKGGTIY